MATKRKKSERKGRVYDPEMLWKLERQLDSADQHIGQALSIVRKELQKAGLYSRGDAAPK